MGKKYSVSTLSCIIAFFFPSLSRTVVTLCPTFGTADCAEVFAQEEPNGWINYKYDVHFDPQWEFREGSQSGNDDDKSEKKIY